MNKMMAVRCPACNERVEGSDSDDLSGAIRSHFADIHKLDMDVRMNIDDEGRECSPGLERPGNGSDIGRREELRGGADALQEGDGEPPGSPTMSMGLAPGGKVDYKERSFEVSDAGATTGMGQFEAGIVTPEGTGTSEETRGIHMFECPLCRQEISGPSEDEVTTYFHDHLVSVHDDEPPITRLIQKARRG
ncbi:MAG: hypothetical protein SA339_11105 [Methanomassiliicoccus sp.]|nr:hypothetical protein [Methanomassiliicoccus sp.]